MNQHARKNDHLLMRIFFVLLLFICICNSSSFSQTGQISIPRISQMPELPSPYYMRNWKEVSILYDALTFDINKSGQYYPFIKLKPAGINYPALQPILLDTYVGTNSSSQAEAINIIPAVIGASLLNINKSNQGGINWVEKIKEFYNTGNGQNVYLNGYGSSSGNDWWYDLMPNVFFFQLYDLYPATPDFDTQFIGVADQWLTAVHAMGGKTTPWTTPQMNYRGWYLSTMTGNNNGVKEPESAGTIAWLLYHAYVKTGEKKYAEGAQMAMEFLSGLTSNPSYELQLPYGTLVAAKMNATIGSNYDIDKMLNWSFDRGNLRGWGTIVGTWNGNDVSGLVGEANDQGNDYAFLMNGFQQAAALVPLTKYDKRYAKAIARWTLNLANASRLLYPEFLESDKQDDYVWSHEYDPQSVIGYEAIKQTWEGKTLYGTGDAKRNDWANTNLALYGSSHVGYLASIVETTDVTGILKLDLNKTDFFGDNHFPTFLFYNPHTLDQQVTLNLGDGFYDLYEALTETNVAENVNGNFKVSIKAGEAMLITLLPAGTITISNNAKLYAGEHVIDYHYEFDFSPDFRIKSLSTKNNLLEVNKEAIVYATIENAPGSVSYKWFINDSALTTTAQENLTWTASSTTGEYEVKVEITSGNKTLKDSLLISVVPLIPAVPVITGLELDKKFYLAGTPVRIIAHVENSTREKFTYTWTVPSGTYEQTDSLLVWNAPSVDGLYAINCVVKNKFTLNSQETMHVLVKHQSTETTLPLAYYPLNLNVNDYSGNDYHAHLSGTQKAPDPLGKPDYAKQFSSSADIIFIDNTAVFNFRDAITLSFWVSASVVGREAFVISHGSWEERWKVSITPDRKLRWTVKTETGVKDLDSTFPLLDNQFYHATVVFSGYSMELYLDGVLDSYSPHNGLMLTTSKAITLGQKGTAATQYYLIGLLDEIRLYNSTLQPNEISLLKDLWQEETITGLEDPRKNNLLAYPNPAKDGIFWIDYPYDKIINIQLLDMNGKSQVLKSIDRVDERIRCTSDASGGIFFLKITSNQKVVFYKIILN